MDTICDELIQEIFHRLPPPPSSATVTTVSKRWLHLFRSSLTTLHLHITTYHPSLTTFLSHHTYLTSLTITTTTTPTNNLVLAIASSCRNLTRLNLASGPIFSNSFLTLASACPKLTSVCVTLARPLLSLDIFSLFTNLERLRLNIVGNNNDNNNSQEMLVSSPPTLLKLCELSLIGLCSNDYAISYLWRNCCNETLTKLVFENCDGLGDNYSFNCFIKELKSIKELELKICRSIVGLVLYKLAKSQCFSLTSLLIYDGGNKEGLLHFIREMKCDLQKLDLRLPLDLDDSHLVEIGVKFNRLRVLRLQSCSMVTSEGLTTLGLALSDNLEELGLTNCDVIKRQNGFLVDLAQSLRKIKILDLSYNHMLLDKEFVSMISSYGELRKLNIRGCSRLTDVSLIVLSRSCKYLESVDMVFCHGIRVKGVEFIILNCTELRKVQVEDRKLSEVARRWMVNKFIEVES